ncbi:hypothetical protein SAMN04487939_11668 [Lysobacter sp. yr284]|uniref:hypothetical protein n=1 Tax=Lysobacter TaxID=68 RepID=UPI000895A14D|nr:hypothetical protein [Lysobacter sp. yr284]SDZ11220.1 hypothetical protein SAMN04487939_11668 [Lysobacter sp. yr284]
MRYPIYTALSLALLLAACKPAASAADATPAPAPAPAVAKAPATAPAPAAAAPAAPAPAATVAEPEIAKSFSKDITYSDLRKRLLGAGWLPLRDPDCRSNVGGEARVCTYLPEVEGCSSDGYCKMWFANRELGLRVRVGTYGPNDRGNTLGNGTATAVRYWEFVGVDAPAAAACPAGDFDQFLTRFAADPALAREFTAPLVKVVELRSDEDGDVPQPVYVLGSAYRGFDVRYRNGAYHFVHEGESDKQPLKLSVSRQGANARLVSYRLNMSEGNSYRFEDKGGCWRLTEDPEPPSP